MVNIEFMCAILTAGKGDPVGVARLAKYIRTHEKFTLDQRNMLAGFIEGKLKRKKGRPRKIQQGNMLMQVAAWQVEDLKIEWRKTGRRYRIHGPAVEAVATRWEITPDKLDNFIRRSKAPRKNR
jgi:hypothetical protein